MPKLYKENEFRDNCGFGLIASIEGAKSRKIVTDSINALISMTHRGGLGSDGKTGDGCGILVDINKDFYKKILKEEQNINLSGRFGVAQIFYFKDLSKILKKIKTIFTDEGLELIAYRNVPLNKKLLVSISLDCMHNIYQLFIKSVSYNVS